MIIIITIKIYIYTRTHIYQMIVTNNSNSNAKYLQLLKPLSTVYVFTAALSFNWNQTAGRIQLKYSHAEFQKADVLNTLVREYTYLLSTHQKLEGNQLTHPAPLPSVPHPY